MRGPGTAKVTCAKSREQHLRPDEVYGPCARRQQHEDGAHIDGKTLVGRGRTAIRGSLAQAPIPRASEDPYPRSIVLAVYRRAFPVEDSPTQGSVRTRRVSWAGRPRMHGIFRAPGYSGHRGTLDCAGSKSCNAGVSAYTRLPSLSLLSPLDSTSLSQKMRGSTPSFRITILAG